MQSEKHLLQAAPICKYRATIAGEPLWILTSARSFVICPLAIPSQLRMIMSDMIARYACGGDVLGAVKFGNAPLISESDSAFL